MIRVLHFSDIHVHTGVLGAPFGDWFGKRLLGGANLLLRRQHWFGSAADTVARLADFADAHGIDAVACTGDYTALGTPQELTAARATVEPFLREGRVFVTTPGNHDVYVGKGLSERRFEAAFADLLKGDVPDVVIERAWGDVFPIVRFIGKDIAFIAISSAQPNPQPWKSSGRVPETQKRALKQIAADSRIAGRLVVLVTHYGLVDERGQPDRPSHGLEDAEELAEILLVFPRCVWLHGHIHWRYHHSREKGGLVTFGAGSATLKGRESAWLYEMDRSRLDAIPLSFRNGAWVLRRERSVSVKWPNDGEVLVR